MQSNKAAVKSKINWTQMVAVVASLAAVLGLDVSNEAQVAIVLVIQSIQSGLTVIFRTWFTDTKIAGFFN